MSSSTTTGVPPAEGVTVPQHASAEQQLTENEASLEIDDSDSTYGDSIYSDTTSLSSSIIRGIVENGRRYQTLREGKYWGPSDEQVRISTPKHYNPQWHDLIQTNTFHRHLNP